MAPSTLFSLRELWPGRSADVTDPIRSASDNPARNLAGSNSKPPKSNLRRPVGSSERCRPSPQRGKPKQKPDHAWTARAKAPWRPYTPPPTQSPPRSAPAGFGGPFRVPQAPPRKTGGSGAAEMPRADNRGGKTARNSKRMAHPPKSDYSEAETYRPLSPAREAQEAIISKQRSSLFKQQLIHLYEHSITRSELHKATKTVEDFEKKLLDNDVRAQEILAKAHANMSELKQRENKLIEERDELVKRAAELLDENMALRRSCFSLSTTTMTVGKAEVNPDIYDRTFKMTPKPDASGTRSGPLQPQTASLTGMALPPTPPQNGAPPTGFFLGARGYEGGAPQSTELRECLTEHKCRRQLLCTEPTAGADQKYSKLENEYNFDEYAWSLECDEELGSLLTTTEKAKLDEFEASIPPSDSSPQAQLRTARASEARIVLKLVAENLELKARLECGAKKRSRCLDEKSPDDDSLRNNEHAVIMPATSDFEQRQTVALESAIAKAKRAEDALLQAHELRTAAESRALNAEKEARREKDNRLQVQSDLNRALKEVKRLTERRALAESHAICTRQRDDQKQERRRQAHDELLQACEDTEREQQRETPNEDIIKSAHLMSVQFAQCVAIQRLHRARVLAKHEPQALTTGEPLQVFRETRGQRRDRLNARPRPRKVSVML